MFRPQIQKTRVLVGLAMLNVLMVYWTLHSYERNPTYGFELKNQAVQIMEDAVSALRLEFRENNINTGKDLDSFGDFLIGPKNSISISTHGNIKISNQKIIVHGKKVLSLHTTKRYLRYQLKDR